MLVWISMCLGRESAFDRHRGSVLFYFRALLSIVGYARSILNEQKKSDFKPENDFFVPECSPVSQSCSNLIGKQSSDEPA